MNCRQTQSLVENYVILPSRYPGSDQLNVKVPRFDETAQARSSAYHGRKDIHFGAVRLCYLLIAVCWCHDAGVLLGLPRSMVSNNAGAGGCAEKCCRWLWDQSDLVPGAAEIGERRLL